MSVPVKLGLVLLSPSKRPIPSTRVAILNLLPLLRLHGFDPVMLHDPSSPDERPKLRLTASDVAAQGIRAVIFQKVAGHDVERTAREFAASGIATVFMVCDIVEPAMVDACHATVVVTDFLRSLYPDELRRKMHVVHDGIEEPERTVLSYREQVGSRTAPLRAVLVTSAHMACLPSFGLVPPWLTMSVMGHYPPAPSRYAAVRNVEWRVRHARGWREAAETLYFAASRRIRCVQWTASGVYDEMASADLGVLPIDNRHRGAPGALPPSWMVKSENRLTLMMSMGLPVIATPIPAYEAVVEHGVNAMFASTTREWQDCLRQLRDPHRRKAIGTAARASVVDRFSKARQARLLVDLILALTARA